MAARKVLRSKRYVCLVRRRSRNDRSRGWEAAATQKTKPLKTIDEGAGSQRAYLKYYPHRY